MIFYASAASVEAANEAQNTAVSMTSQGFLDNFALTIIEKCSQATDHLLPYVLFLMSVILMWNIITNWDLYWGKQDYSKLIPLVVTATFFVAAANSWQWILEMIFKFGSEIGTTASNNTTYTLSGHFVESVTPSTIVNEGIYNAILVLKGSLLGTNPENVAKGASAAVKAKAITLSLKSAASVLKGGITGHVVFSIIHAIITLLLFGFIAISYLYTILEFFIIGTISMVLLPFGLLDRTKAIVDKILNFFFISAIRIGIFVFLITIINPVLKETFETANFVDSILGIDVLSAMLSLFALAFLAFKTPSFAAALFNGAVNSPPSLTGIGAQAIQMALMVKTLAASKAAAAANGTRQGTEETVKDGVKRATNAESNAINTSRKDAITDVEGSSSNKSGTTQSTTDTTETTNHSGEETSTATTDQTKKSAINDSSTSTDTSSKESSPLTTSEDTVSSEDSNYAKREVSNYLDQSEGSTKENESIDTASSSNSFNSNANSHTNGPITRDMVNREIEKTKNEDSATSTETSSNKALHTIKEFKTHNLKSNEDEE
jgi:PREDICTED: nuclear factor I/X (CCAAT-binding transcription factor)-like, partial